MLANERSPSLVGEREWRDGGELALRSLGSFRRARRRSGAERSVRTTLWTAVTQAVRRLRRIDPRQLGGLPERMTARAGHDLDGVMLSGDAKNDLRERPERDKCQSRGETDQRAGFARTAHRSGRYLTGEWPSNSGRRFPIDQLGHIALCPRVS